MKKHILIPATAILFFFSSSALANSTIQSINTLKKSSQKQTTVKYEFSLFQIGYSLMKEKTDTTTKIVTQRPKNEGK
tara:strand:+ start:4168 stop:4398 length:231 start_codon:yes stop_codon:yes gene_type:complete